MNTARGGHNPLATRYVRPGAVEYLFPPGVDAGQLLDRLAAHHWWGQIVGPHGAGKSTLLATLLPRLARAGRGPLPVVLHNGQRRLPIDLRAADLPAATQLVIDGYEQLSRVERWRVRRWCRRRGWGLLVTAHDDVGLPEVFRCAVDAPLAVALVTRLAGPQAFSPEEIAQVLADQHGNLREALFALYDRYEARRGGRS
jgi:hypothetical protein